MKRRFSFLMLTLIIVAVMLFSAARPYTVYADDVPPPPPDTGEVVDAPPEAAPAATEPAPEATTADPAVAPTVAPVLGLMTTDPAAVPVDPAAVPVDLAAVPVDPAAVPVDPAAAPLDPAVVPVLGLATTIPVEEPTTLPEILEAAPPATDVVALDENGDPLPMAAQETAEVLATADPTWCPGSSLPGSGGCVSGDSFNGVGTGLFDQLELCGAACTARPRASRASGS